MIALLAAAAIVHTIEILDSKLLNTFVPQIALGAGVDGHEFGDVDRIYRPSVIRAMREVGFRSLTYRLRTELGVEAWHWNPQGSWSGNSEGYWTSSGDGDIRSCFGYRLPRRGDSRDQANDDGYSRIDDGDASTFWKSNPYLTRRYTGDDDRLHPQDVYIDLGSKHLVNRIEIDWAEPFARTFTVAYWNGEDQHGEADGLWQTFSHGAIANGHGGNQSILLSGSAVSTRWMRIRMTVSSNSCSASTVDSRDRCGFAIREVYAGLQIGGRFRDWISHAKSHEQSDVFVSSTDPWHRETDIDRRTEQPGFDLVFRSGLSSGLPILIPVPTIYGTPEEAAGIVRYLESKHIPLKGIELGEEPDGQSISPEDYAALYVQVAEAIRKVDPEVPLGGPSFETIQADAFEFPHPPGKSWTERFVAELRRRHRLDLWQFCSFEFYGWDDVVDPPRQLQSLRRLVSRSIDLLKQSGMPSASPFIISEYGWSPYAAWPEVDIDGALYDAELLGTFFSLGGQTAYLYGYEPSSLMNERPGNGWGDNLLFLSHGGDETALKVARYWGAWMINHCWAVPATQSLKLYAAKTEGLLRAYPLRLPDQSWSILLLNLDAERPSRVRLTRSGSPGAERDLEVWQFGRDQYSWKPADHNGKPLKSSPPAHFTSMNDLILPPYSETVVRLRSLPSASPETASP